MRNTLRTDLQDRLVPVLRGASTPRGLYEAVTALGMTDNKVKELQEVLAELDMSGDAL